MSHENDNGVTEPLLPARFKGRSNSLSSSPNVVYDGDSTGHVERGEGHVKNRPLRDSYLKQLGYTPLIFKPNDDDLLSDAFPYHQSIIPSKGSIRGSVFNLAGATLGAGALSLPYAVAVSGLGFAVAQLVLAAILTVYTIRLLIRAEDITKYETQAILQFYMMTDAPIIKIIWSRLKSYEDLAMYCFGTKVNVFSIYTELQRPCIRRMNKVVDRATLISFLIYLSIGVVAYLAFGPQLAEPKYKGNILLSFPLNDTLIAISRAAITFTVAVAFPLNIFPCRFTIDMMFFSNSEDSWPRHVAVTSGLVLLALLLAIFCPSINVVFGIIGGTCSTVVCFCFPAAFILKLEDGPLLGPKKIGPLLLFIGAIVIGFLGTGVTVWSSLLMPPA
ncbi:Gamma-tubulin complex component 6 [Phytophthora nicotianae]|uniref:Gamma-tubulin complex component 6 n=1 Tax=Phytophthora nicotianae TaxID=4792 RepID=A0A0W8CQX2_PHYNI|nr:Gamma-tubulin complex component 6 [Phytophthora nicotianae]